MQAGKIFLEEKVAGSREREQDKDVLGLMVKTNGILLKWLTVA